MSEPINIPGADGGGTITVTVKTPNGTLQMITLHDSVNHPATVFSLKSEVEALYPALFPNWDAAANPVQIYTADWADIDDDYQELIDGDTYGVCPSEQQQYAHDQHDEEIFQFEQ